MLYNDNKPRICSIVLATHLPVHSVLSALVEGLYSTPLNLNGIDCTGILSLMDGGVILGKVTESLYNRHDLL